MSSMLRKKEVFTVITPIPGFIPRQLAIDILHSHSEVITLNPLVLDHKPIKAPRTAASDEYYSTWYEIEQRIQYIPGIGKMGSGRISFNGCFHDMPWGLQTHIYAPMNVDLKNRYRIAGNQPGVEPPETQEIGLSQLGAPSDGLYLRDDVEIKCNLAVVSFVKSQLKAASKEMVTRIIKKAELLDAGILHAMIDNGKLRTINPNDRTISPDGSISQQYSPSLTDRFGAMSPEGGARPYMVPRPSSYQHLQRPGHMGHNNSSSNNGNNNNTHWSAPYGGVHQTPSQRLKAPEGRRHAELADEGGQAVPYEMAGDFAFPQSSPRLAPPQDSPTYPPSEHSNVSTHSSSQFSQQTTQHGAKDWRWSQGSGVSSVSGAMNSPGLPAERPNLPTHSELPEQEYSLEALRKMESVAARRAQYLHTPPPPQSQQQQQKSFAYNPADYAKVGRASPRRNGSYQQNQ